MSPNYNANRPYRRQVFYNPNVQFIETEMHCKFCTRTVYFDTQHLNKNGRGIPHDWPIEKYRDPTNVIHHGDHCPDINGNQSDREYYAALRKKKGMPDPWYHNQKQEPSWTDEEYDEPTAAAAEEEALDAFNQRNTSPEPPHPTTSNFEKKEIGLTGEELLKNLVASNGGKIGLLHKRINKRKEEIADIREALRSLEVQTDILTKSFNDYIYTMGNALKNLGYEANKIIMDEIEKSGKFGKSPISPKKGERLDDYGILKD